MKKYIQLKDTWRTRAGDEWIQLSKDTTLYLHYDTQTLEKEEVLKAHPEWFKEVTDIKPSFKKWRAEKRIHYYYLSADGTVGSTIDLLGVGDNYRYLTGNYFQTREEAEAYKSRQEAIGRVTHAIIEANEGWEPDWEDLNQDKCDIVVDREKNIITSTCVCFTQSPVLFPYARTKNIALSIISSHKEDLNLIFNVKK